MSCSAVRWRCTVSSTGHAKDRGLGGERFQRCKRDVRDRNFPCDRPRCRHGWMVRYREPGGRRGRQRERSIPRRVGSDGADTFADKVENGRPAFTSFLRVGLCRCGSGLGTGWSGGSSVSRRAATTKDPSITILSRAWGGRCWPGWCGATSRSCLRGLTCWMSWISPDGAGRVLDTFTRRNVSAGGSSALKVPLQCLAVDLRHIDDLDTPGARAVRPGRCSARTR